MGHMHDYPEPGKYLALCRKAFALTAQGIRVQLAWNSRPLDAAGWKRQFIQDLHFRINRKEGPYDVWRKQDPDYQVKLRRDQDRLHQKIRARVRVYQFETDDVRRRYGHLLDRYDDL
mgnify:FL=1